MRFCEEKRKEASAAISIFLNQEVAKNGERAQNPSGRKNLLMLPSPAGRPARAGDDGFGGACLCQHEWIGRSAFLHFTSECANKPNGSFDETDDDAIADFVG